MAEKGASSSGGDWTAGIVAIVAALLLGSAIPIGLYFGLYKPKVADRVAANKKLETLKIDMTAMVTRSDKVRKLETEGDEMAIRVAKIEEDFAVSDPERMDVPDAWAAIQKLAEDNFLELLPERKTQLGARVVFKANNRIEFENGLRATKLRIEAQAYFHDFARFVSKMEYLEKFVVVPEMLICKGDTNGGTTHMFVMEVYVVERRDVDRIGR
jgi:Tfp pilus assembly protein PilO